jgi:hypothetical protein
MHGQPYLEEYLLGIEGFNKKTAWISRLLVIVLPILIGIALQSWHSPALAQASGQGQAQTRLRSVVSRVAFQYIIASAIDLPLTLRPCATEEERAVAYDIVKRIVAGEQADRAMQKALCHPHFGQPQYKSADEGSLTFDLPSRDCAAIRNSIQVILQDRSEQSYTQLLDRPKQRQIDRVFVIIKLYGGRHVFPNTSDTGYSKYFEFLVQECSAKGDRAELVILMRRRKGGTSDAR